MFAHRSVSKAHCISSGQICRLQRGSAYHILNCLPNMSGAQNEKSAVDPSKKSKNTRSVWRKLISSDSSCSAGTAPKSGDAKLRILADGGPVQDQTRLKMGIKDSVVGKSEGLRLGLGHSTLGDSSKGKEVEDLMEDKKNYSRMINKECKHSKIVEVDAALLRFIKGKWGSTQKSIEEDTGVRIIFPSSKDESNIVIESASAENIKKASDKIQEILAEAVESRSLDYSHFISLPLAIHSELVEKLTVFQNSVLGIVNLNQEIGVNTNLAQNVRDDLKIKDGLSASGVGSGRQVQSQENDEKPRIAKVTRTYYPPKAQTSSTLSDLYIDQSIFIKPATFHLTVLMLKLWNKERVDAATKVLKNISSKVNDALGGQPVTIRMKGLDCMKGSPAKARVVYVPIEEIGGKDRLMQACHIIIDAYIEAGLVVDKDSKQKLKLHATVMNSRHRKRSLQTRKDDSFDARNIFQQYGSYEWGDYMIREAHLSQRFVFGRSGYYHCCASIPFPRK